MWGFVRNMGRKIPSFVAARRARGVQSDEQDPNAYGAGFAPNPPIIRSSTSSGSSLSSCTCSSTASSVGDNESVDMDVGARQPSMAKKLRGLAAFAIAGSLALLVHRGGGKTDGGSLPSDFRRRGRGALARSSSMPLMLPPVGLTKRSSERFMAVLESE